MHYLDGGRYGGRLSGVEGRWSVVGRWRCGLVEGLKVEVKGGRSVVGGGKWWVFAVWHGCPLFYSKNYIEIGTKRMRARVLGILMPTIFQILRYKSYLHSAVTLAVTK